jgi:hypothetical protein
MKKKILTIGDIHGRSVWKNILFGSESGYDQWKEEIDNEAKESFDNDYPLDQYDRVIFVGDYVDSFTVDNVNMIKNLEDLISLKKKYPEKIVLLLGNHDVQYIDNDHFCSGYRPEMQFDLHKIFNDNIDLFQMAYLMEIPLIEGRKNRKVLWTHAGVTKGWLNSINKSAFYNPKHRLFSILRGTQKSEIDEKLNLAWALRINSIFAVDYQSGGLETWAGPLWVRPGILTNEGVSEYDQIVGHTPKRTITKILVPLSDVESNPDKQDLIVVTDTLEYGDQSTFEIEYDEN